MAHAVCMLLLLGTEAGAAFRDINAVRRKESPGHTKLAELEVRLKTPTAS